MVHISRPRCAASFRRKPGDKSPRSITLIVCEGKTEQEYFDTVRVHYGLSRTEAIIADNTDGSAPISVVECALRKHKEAGGYDWIFCVFDRDDHESFQRAREKIAALSTRQKKPLPINEAVSIPCFELWLLLHFARTDAGFPNCSAVIQQLQHHSRIPGYEKADAHTTQLLMTHINTAIGNAEWLEARAEVNGWNPYTSVHRLLRHLARIANDAGL
jgi:hypothetical protein